MPELDLVVVGASAGGLQALEDIIGRLPSTLRTPILVVVHTRSDGDGYLPRILSRTSRRPVAFAGDGDTITPGHIYIAPPDAHLMVDGRGIRLGRGPRENGFRPAVDPLFRSASRVYGPRVMGVILSGALDDGSYGLKVLKDGGGIAVVQDPNEARFPSMPLNALRVVDVDHVLTATAIADFIVEASGRPGQGEERMARKKRSEPTELEPQNPGTETSVEEMVEALGLPSGLTCPDCGGALWEVQDSKLVRYRCHVGHQFTPEALDSAQRDEVEGALWGAVRVLEEHSELRKRMAQTAEVRGMEVVSAGFTESAHESQRQAHTIRELILGRAASPPADRDNPEAKRPRNGRSRKTEPKPNGRGRSVNGRGRKPTRRAR